MLKDNTNGGSNGNKLDVDIFGLGRRIMFLSCRDILGNLSKEGYQTSFSVQQTEERTAQERCHPVGRGGERLDEGVGPLDVFKRPLEGDDHCCSQFVTSHSDCVELFSCFRVSARRKETFPP